MIVIISGTNRPGSATRKVVAHVEGSLRQAGVEAAVVDLADLPAELFDPASYATKPASFAPFQEAILTADGILVVTPEYNGSYPGILKYFIDMLRFPESLYQKPAAFIGLSAGRWGALRAVEQLEMIFQYRHAHLFGRRVFVPGVATVLGADGGVVDRDVAERLDAMAIGFADFCRRLAD